MESIANITSVQQAISYFASKKEYFLNKDDPHAGQWWGRGAEALGLRGAIDRDDFCELLQGKLPTGESLATKFDGKRRCATDVTFSAPKSVSILALVFGQKALIEAHEAAVRVAMAYLQDRAINCRMSKDGHVDLYATNNVVAALCQHHTSRELDPQLHTHVLLLNMTQMDDGRWKAIDNTDLYNFKMLGGAIYRAELARLVRGMGYTIGAVGDDGCWELEGFTTQQLDTFSKRRVEIVEALQGPMGEKLRAAGLNKSEAAQQATLLTRKTKRDVDPEAMLGLWREEATQAGIALGDVAKNAAQVNSARRAEPSGKERAAAADESLQWALEHVLARKAVFDEHEIVLHALRHRMGRITAEDVHAAMARCDELVVAGEPRVGQTRYTTYGMLDLEFRTNQVMLEGKNRFDPIAKAAAIDSYFESTSLTTCQARGAKMILRNEDLVVGIQGHAGTGKTHMLRVVRELAEQAGYTVKGVAVSSSAAGELARGAGIRSRTVASHLAKIEHPSRHDKGEKRTEKELWIVDESSFIGTRLAYELLRHAKARRARVVLVGDRDQLPSIEAGCPFSELCDRGMRKVVLQEILRQKTPHTKAAVRETINRRHDAAVAALQGHIHEITDEGERLAAAADTYLKVPRDKRDSTMLVTATNAERRQLNGLVRAGLKAEGSLGAESITGTVWVRRDLTPAELKRSLSYEVGDVVVTHRRGGYKRFGMEQGAPMAVVGIDTSCGVRLRDENGRQTTWRPAQAAKVEVYRCESRELAAGDRIRWTRNDNNLGRSNGETFRIDAINTKNQHAIQYHPDGGHSTYDLQTLRHWEHAYASTLDLAQGATCEHLIANLNTRIAMRTGHQPWYVAISRTTTAVSLFTDDQEELPLAIVKNISKESALATVEYHAKERERRTQTLAVESNSGRQTEPWMRDAAHSVARGHADVALAEYRNRGHVHAHDAESQLIETLTDNWIQHHEERPQALGLMVAATRKQVDLLNTLARDYLRDTGELGEDVRVQTTYGARDIAVGDRMAFFRSCRELGVRAGDVATVKTIVTGSDKTGGTTLTVACNGRDVEVDLSKFGHLDYAYATTPYRAACLQVDAAFIAASVRFDRAQASTALSRHARHAEIHWSKATFANEQGVAAAFARAPGAELDLEHLGSRELLQKKRQLEGLLMQISGTPSESQGQELAQRKQDLQRVELLYEIRRQQHAWMQDATAQLGAGHHQIALDAYQQRGQIRRYALESDAIEAAFDGWVACTERHESAFVIAHTRKQVALINTLARDELRAAGRLGADHLVATEYGQRAFAVGDRVALFRSDRTLGIRSGDSAEIQAVEGAKFTLRLGGRDVKIDTSMYRHLDHGYAVTTQRSRRMQADHVFVIGSEHFDRESTRVAMTRHRCGLELHWASNTFVDETAMRTAMTREPNQAVANEDLGIAALNRRRRQLEFCARADGVQADFDATQRLDPAEARAQLIAVRQLIDQRREGVDANLAPQENSSIAMLRDQDNGTARSRTSEGTSERPAVSVLHDLSL